jgi:outer membrane biogenesis lipoprotein LolB
MKKKKRPIGAFPVIWVLTVLTLVLLDSCTWLVAPPADEQDARQLISSLAMQNAGLEQAKGLLNLKLEAKSTTLVGRAAWVAAVPNRLRIEWLNTMGQPVARLAGDGRTLTIQTLEDNKIHHLRQSRTALHPLIHLPIGIEDLVAVLAGRPLLPAYVAAQEKPSEGDGRMVILKNRWHRPLARFWFNGADELLRQEIYETDGALRYRLVWLAWNRSGSFAVPEKVLLQAGTGETLTLSMERFWPNARFQPQTFVIEDPAESDM